MSRKRIKHGLEVLMGLAGVLFCSVCAGAESVGSQAVEPSRQPNAEMMDVIRLSNGNKIIGHVTGTEDGVAEIRIDGVGEMEISLSDITSITQRPCVPVPRPSPQEQRLQEDRQAQERRQSQEEYRRYVDRRFRQQDFDEGRRRQLQLEADWREFLNHPNINSRFQEDMFFTRFGGGGRWGRFAPWGGRGF